MSATLWTAPHDTTDMDMTTEEKEALWEQEEADMAYGIEPPGGWPITREQVLP